MSALLLSFVVTNATGAPSEGPLTVSASTDITVPSDDVDVASAAKPAARFVARKEPVENLFKAIGSEIRKAVRFSNKARQYRVSGEFDLKHPFEVIERVTSSLGLIWYFDGQVIYVYDNAEAASAMLAIAPQSIDGLIAFLKASALYDKRYPIKHTPGTRVIYVSGPPKYVEIVQGAASLMHTQAEVSERSDRHVELVKIRHASVAGRSYSRRGERETVAGLASVLAAALGSGASVREVASTTPAPTTSAVDTPRDASAMALPAGVREMPSLESSLPMAAAMLNAPTQAMATTRREPAPKRADADGALPMNIVAYPATNSLLLEGTERQLATARRLIAQLDVPKEQVELSLWVIDVKRDNLDMLGAKWGAAMKLGGLQATFDFGALGRGSTLSRNQTTQFLASITAMSTENKARIVSRPILLAQDNSPAVFDNSKTFLIRVSGERVATLEKITYGTMIDVTPHVVDVNGRIEMELNIEDGTSAKPTENSGLDLPVVASTKISTVARVQHEQSILVGGYTQSTNTEGVDKIPLLGDIPWLGRLFTFRNTTDHQTIRLFLIQPRLLGDDNRFDEARLRTPVEIDDAVEALRQQLKVKHG